MAAHVHAFSQRKANKALHVNNVDLISKNSEDITTKITNNKETAANIHMNPTLCESRKCLGFIFAADSMGLSSLKF